MSVKNLYYEKYLKYKNKYLNLQGQIGGGEVYQLNIANREITDANKYITMAYNKYFNLSNSNFWDNKSPVEEVHGNILLIYSPDFNPVPNPTKVNFQIYIGAELTFNFSIEKNDSTTEQSFVILNDIITKEAYILSNDKVKLEKIRKKKVYQLNIANREITDANEYITMAYNKYFNLSNSNFWDNKSPVEEVHGNILLIYSPDFNPVPNPTKVNFQIYIGAELTFNFSIEKNDSTTEQSFVILNDIITKEAYILSNDKVKL